MPNRDYTNIQKYITWDVRSKSSKYLDEFENNITKSVNDSNIIIINALLDKINDKSKLDIVYENVEKIRPASDDILLNLSNTLAPNVFLDKISTNFLEVFFDKTKDTYSSNIAAKDFVKIESANAIIKMCSLLLLCYIAKNKIPSNELANHFQVKKVEKEEIIEEKTNSTVVESRNNVKTNNKEEKKITTDEIKPKSYKKLIIGLFILIAISIGVYFLSQTSTEKEIVAIPKIVDTETQSQNIDGELVTNLGDFIDITLPSDEILTIPEKSVEKAILDLVLDKSKSVEDSGYWLLLDRVRFIERQTEYTVDSEEQIKNLALIMSSFPKTAINIGCYTDNLGKPESNKTLSLKRSESLKNGLIKFGIQENRVSIEGFGQEFPIGDNTTEEGRKQNRRISIKLTAK